VIRLERRLPGGAVVVIRFSEVIDGDLAPWSDGVEERRRSIDQRPWTWLEQEHAAGVVSVRRPGDGAGAPGDASVTTTAGVVLSAQMADCAPVALWSDEGVIGVVHAGWRGLVAGVLPAAVGEMHRQGAGTVRGALGPCIRAVSYRFSVDDLDRVVSVIGEEVRGHTAAGEPALDIAAGVRASLAGAGVIDLHDVGADTATSPRLWSWRADRTRSRQAVLVVKDAPEEVAATEDRT